MSLVTRTAVPADLERLLPALDQEFVFGKGRSTSLAHRFPAVYCGGNAGHIFLTEENGEALSVLASKRFELHQGGRSWRGAMIGGVHTRPERRGEGLAGALLERAAESLRDEGCDFAVLWTGKPVFYARHGWHACDDSVIGEADHAPSPAPASSDLIERMPAAATDCARIDGIRQRWCEMRVTRSAEDYRQLPLPAEAVDLLLHGGDAQPDAYALVGKAGDRRILYELVGDPGAFPALWAEAGRGGSRLLVNERGGSPSQRWLAEHADLAWENKPLAMWLPLSAAGEAAKQGIWHVPYFDRI